MRNTLRRMNRSIMRGGVEHLDNYSPFNNHIHMRALKVMPKLVIPSSPNRPKQHHHEFKLYS